MKYNYMVSIRLMTYNHEDYIADALKGILLQKTNFKVEVVVGDDFSDDNTLEIINQYSDTEKIKFKVLSRKIGDDYWVKRQKYGRKYNFLNILDNCSGKYIALLDGDDYWTDKYKLQKQVDFLEKKLDFSLCCGAYETYNEVTKERKKEILNIPNVKINKNGFSFGLNEMKYDWITKSLNTVFRRKYLDEISFLDYSYFRDVHLIYHLLKKGKGFYFKNIFGVYRLHQGGVHSMKSKLNYYNNAYLIYKELHQRYSDDFTKYKYKIHTISLLHYVLYHSKKDICSVKRINLLKESYALAKANKEFLLFLKAFSPIPFFLESLAKLKRIIVSRMYLP